MNTTKHARFAIPFMGLMLACCGCNILAPSMAIFAADQTQKVTAEYGGLKGKRVCVWVWADEGIRFDYPAVCQDIAAHAKFFIQQNVNCTFVDLDEIAKFQRSDYDAYQSSVVDIGKRFNADAVLFIQVLEFRIHPEEIISLSRAHIETQCALYDCTGEQPAENRERQLWTGRIDIDYPKGRPKSTSEATPQQVRSESLKVFGATLAKKFYNHRERLDED